MKNKKIAMNQTECMQCPLEIRTQMHSQFQRKNMIVSIKWNGEQVVLWGAIQPQEAHSTLSGGLGGEAVDGGKAGKGR